MSPSDVPFDAVYEMHLNGAGFDDFVIRARSSQSGGRHPNIARPRFG
jgi:hypothetical protein